MITRLTQLEWRRRFLETGKKSGGDVWIHRLPLPETAAAAYAAARRALDSDLPLEELAAHSRYSKDEAIRAAGRYIRGDLPADAFVSLGKCTTKSTPHVEIRFAHDAPAMVGGSMTYIQDPLSEWIEPFTDSSWPRIERWLRNEVTKQARG